MRDVPIRAPGRRMRLARRRAREWAVVSCHGRFDRSALQAVDRQIGEARSAGRPVIVIDLGGVTHVDNDALSALCVTLRSRDAADVRIAGADGRVRWVLELCAIDGLRFSRLPFRALVDRRTEGATRVHAAWSTSAPSQSGTRRFRSVS